MKARHSCFAHLIQKELKGWQTDQGDENPHDVFVAREALQTLCEAYHAEFELYAKEGVEWLEWLRLCGFDME